MYQIVQDQYIYVYQTVQESLYAHYVCNTSSMSVAQVQQHKGPRPIGLITTNSNR